MMLHLIPIGFLEIGWIDIVDILLVSLLLYQLYQLVKGSVAEKILLGGLAIFVLWLLVRTLEMELLSTILGQFIGVGVIAALIVFQQEIRKFLLMIGKGNYFGRRRFFLNLWGGGLNRNTLEVDVFIEAAQEMSISQTGALMVFAKSTELKFYAESGDALDAIASKRLIISIFNKYSPMHDGAMIIGKGGRIIAVRCILPVSENDELPASLGLRHRSAIGLTEVTDAVVVVVSEETGHISIVKNGKIQRNLSPKELKEKLIFYLTIDKEKRIEKIPKSNPEKVPQDFE
ncbi:MAG: diadenylate cyclase CdaA [Microscillaceae bacterium]|nr:diadenylate cyclase CdaA [Microscillaceae bacterium]